MATVVFAQRPVKPVDALMGTWRLVESPDYIDTDPPHPFKVKGDRLESTDGKTWRRMLERADNECSYDRSSEDHSLVGLTLPIQSSLKNVLSRRD